MANTKFYLEKIRYEGEQKDLLVRASQVEVGSGADAKTLPQALAAKQDNLVFNTTYNAESNKAATMQDVTDAVAGLQGAMHFVGSSTQDPTKETTPGTQDGPAGIEGYTTPAAGDVVTFGKKEYLYDGSAWREYGDEGDYAVKGSIKNADIAADAAIEQSKIANLGTDLGAKADKVTGAVEGNFAGLDADGNLTDSGKKASDFVAAEANKRLMTEDEGTKLAAFRGVRVVEGESTPAPADMQNGELLVRVISTNAE